VDLFREIEMKTGFRIIAASYSFLLLSIPPCHAQSKQPAGRPPATVVVSEVKSGSITPHAEFVGTVYYVEVSDVAAESRGRIEVVNVEEGHRVEKGDILVKLNSELLQKTLQGTIASHEEVVANLEKARSDLTRIENLYRKQVVPEQLYDENKFKVQSLEKRSASLMAEVERLKIELERMVIRAPFRGVVLKKHVDTGEWLQPGSTVATIARDEVVDIVADVPEPVLRFVKTGMELRVKVIGTETKGKVFAVLPRGDVATRTFPVKVRMDNTLSLAEGMEARVSLPTGERKNALIIPRDAVITLFGQPTVFAIIESKAKMVPVNVIGYEGTTAALEGPGLAPGMAVVIKGNERLIDGQVVTVNPGNR
jgi:membrane fusion protein (multidrug efflux system)